MQFPNRKPPAPSDHPYAPPGYGQPPPADQGHPYAPPGYGQPPPPGYGERLKGSSDR